MKNFYTNINGLASKFHVVKDVEVVAEKRTAVTTYCKKQEVKSSGDVQKDGFIFTLDGALFNKVCKSCLKAY